MSRNVVDSDGWTTVGKPKITAPAPASGLKWGQSAIRKKERKEESFDAMFPSLGTPLGRVSPVKEEKAPVVSMAEKMKQKLAEEEEERRKKEEERLRKEQESNKKSTMLGYIHPINLRADTKFHEDEDDYEVNDGLDYDSYGYKITDDRTRVNEYDYQEPYEEEYEYEDTM
jgi:hypothetical protein